MSTSSVVHLAEYRSRRDERLRQLLALYRCDPERIRVVERLADAVSFLGAERGAAVWVDEYGPGLVHVHSLLDLAATSPRRSFSIDPLRAAWEVGVPGFLDIADSERAGTFRGIVGIPRSLCIVALGSDGSRAWFLVADSSTPRLPLNEDATAHLMFLAGECASILLHRDLDRVGAADPGARSPRERERRESFAAWPVLQDIQGREDDEPANRRISCRFLVARVIRTLLDEDFAVDARALGYQVAGVRREVTVVDPSDPERRSWESVLEAVESGNRGDLLASLLDWGNRVEDLGHVFGAQEIHRISFDVSVVVGSLGGAVDAARFHGRASRKLSEYDLAEQWYRRALSLAESMSDLAKKAVILDGLASTYRELGNLPKARATLDEELEVATQSGSAYALGSCHHNRMTLEIAQGNWAEAIVHGWKAFGIYPEDASRLIALLDLGEVFVQCGSYRSAEDAYSVVVLRTGNAAVRALALGGLARVAALRGDAAGFEEWCERADALEWRSLPASFRAQIAFDRGLAHRALGDRTEARMWLGRARADAEAYRLNQLSFRAERELELLDEADVVPANVGEMEDTGDDRVADVLHELTSLRKSLQTA